LPIASRRSQARLSLHLLSSMDRRARKAVSSVRTQGELPKKNADTLVFNILLIRELQRLSPGLTEYQYQEMARSAIRQAADLAQKSGLAAALAVTSCAAWLLIGWGARLGSFGSVPSSQKTESKAAQTAAADKFCINCGISLRANATFCNKCGSRQR